MSAVRVAILAALVLVVVAAVGSHRRVAASGPIQRTVGPYVVSFGYTNDPEYMEELATVQVSVHDAATGAPVTGLENQLKAAGRITVLDVTKDFGLTFVAFEDRPGVYEAVFIPPKPGDYSYHLTGSINGTPIDEAYTTGETGLTPIGVRTDIEYGERGSIISTVILGAYVVGLALLLLFMLHRRRLRRRASAAP